MASTSTLDDVAALAASGAAPIVIAVCRNLEAIDQLAGWLRSAVPTFGAYSVTESTSSRIDEHLREGFAESGVVVIPDAGFGNDVALRARWSAWNGQRERFVQAVSEGRVASFVFLVTSACMGEISAVSPHLFSIAAVLTLDGTTPERVAGTELEDAYREAIGLLEERYGLSTADLLAKVLKREEVAVSAEDMARWLASAEALRTGDV